MYLNDNMAGEGVQTSLETTLTTSCADLKKKKSIQMLILDYDQ
jgi:hypothetical protein